MVAFTFQKLLAGGPASYLTGITDLDIRQSAGGPVLYAASGPDGGITSYALGAGGASFLDRDAFQPGQTQASAAHLAETTIGNKAVLVTTGQQGPAPQCFDLGTDGQLTGTGQLTAKGGFPAAIVSMETVTVGAREFVYINHFGMDGITVYEPDATGQLVRIGNAGQSGGTAQMADLVAVESVDLGGQSFLLTLSAVDNALTSYRLGSNGIPTAVDTVGAATGLGLAAPTGLVPVVVDGVQYLVVGAAGTSSLTVLQMTQTGDLVQTDHVLDDLNTRFQGITALEAVTVGGRTYLVAGGADDGLSLFTLLPGGRLMHLAQIADGTATGLTNVSALALHGIRPV